METFQFVSIINTKIMPSPLKEVAAAIPVFWWSSLRWQCSHGLPSCFKFGRSVASELVVVGQKSMSQLVCSINSSIQLMKQSTVGVCLELTTAGCERSFSV